MEENQQGPLLLVAGIVLIIIDWTLLAWFPSLMLTYVGICLICSGCCRTSRASRGGYSSSYKAPQYSPAPAPAPQQPAYIPAPAPQTVEEKASYCPNCGATVKGNFCPECGSQID